MLTALLVSTLLCTPQQPGSAPAKPAAGQAADAARELDVRFQILSEQYTRTENEWSEQLRRLASYPDQRAQLIAKHPVKEYWERFEALAKDGEGRCLLWLTAHADKMYAEKAEAAQRKLALCRRLIDEYASAPWGKEIPIAISLQRHWFDIQGVDDLLEAFVKKTPNREFAAEAISRDYALYMSLSVRGEGKERAAALNARLLQEYGDTEAGRTRYEQISAQELARYINQPAALAAGKDVEGAELDLAALKGKAVLLTFWTTADPRAPALVQNLRELAGRHAQDPFVVLGVSSDEDAARFREFAKAHNVGWRSIWEGSRLGPVSQAHHVTRLPTMFLIDGGGVVRQVWVGVPDAKVLDQRVEIVVAPLRTGR